MDNWTRRGFIAAGTAGLTACSPFQSGRPAERIDSRSDAAVSFMYDEIPGTRDLAARSSGMLIMPIVTKAGFGIGGAYGEGSLRIGGATVSYYNTAQASIGFQFGAQQYAHTLFFMTPESLSDFRASDGWALGADAEYVVQDRAGRIGTETTNVLSPIIAVVYGQAGLIIGVTLEGTKYSQIFRS
ncbi:MAG: lipid-binding SYLF domain-containing protein [Gammaproteobacteria bacterium]|jgi:lipid-binding SYLF domain-containing protein